MKGDAEQEEQGMPGTFPSDSPHQGDDATKQMDPKTEQPTSSASNGSGPWSRRNAVTGTPLERIDALAAHFTIQILPVCEKFKATPPADPKSRAQCHKKLEAAAMQQVILKLDAMDLGGDDAARKRRKEVTKQVMDVLGGMDDKLQS